MNTSNKNQLITDRIIIYLWGGESLDFPKDGGLWFVEFKERYVEVVSNGYNPKERGFVARNLTPYQSIKAIEVFKYEGEVE